MTNLEDTEVQRAVYTLCPAPQTGPLMENGTRAKAQIPPEGRGMKRGARHRSSPQFCTRCGSGVSPGSARGGARSPFTVQPSASATLVQRLRGLRLIRAQGFLYQDEVFKLFLPREVALHSHAHLPRSDHEFPTRIPSQIPPSCAITAPPLARWRRAHFRCVFLRVRPGGRCRCRPTGSSLFATQTITVMACGQFGWSRAALLHLLLGLNLMVMPPTQARSLRFVTLVTT